MLACIGTYGMMAYSVSARSRDVGIRMALGATASRVLWGLEPFDPLTFLVVVLAFGTIVMIAVAVPALRAARLHPARVLRQ